MQPIALSRCWQLSAAGTIVLGAVIKPVYVCDTLLSSKIAYTLNMQEQKFLAHAPRESPATDAGRAAPPPHGFPALPVWPPEGVHRW